MMSWPPEPTHIGISPVAEGYRMAAVSLLQDGFRVQACWKAPTFTPPPEVADAEEAFYTLGLPSSEVLVRQLELKLSKAADIQAVLPFETEPLIPFPIEDAAFDTLPVSKEKGLTRLKVIVTRKDHAGSSLDKAGLEPDQVEVLSCTAVGLTYLNTHLFQDSTPRLLLHVGESEVDGALVQGSHLLEASNFSFTGEASSRLRQSLHRSIMPIFKKHQPELLLLGPRAADPEIVREVEQLFRVTPCDLPMDRVQGIPPNELSAFAAPIGLALTPMDAPFNFRGTALPYPKPWRRLKKPLVLTWCLSLFLALIALLLGKQHLQKRTEALVQEYRETAALIQRDEPEQLPDSPEDLAFLLAELEDELEKSREPFPLYPLIPRVKDMLSWLVDHPQLQEDVELQGFHYTVVKRPQKGAVRDRYQVKVELEIATPVPRFARSFHDSLLQNSDLIDKKQAVNWATTSRGTYKATFFLKDKTRYWSQR